MKSRLIYPRNSYLTVHDLKTGHNYLCKKLDGDKLSDDDFWFRAIVWIWPDYCALDGIGNFAKGNIAAIVKGTLYPAVMFDIGYRFVPICFSNTLIEAKFCRNKACNFTKTI